MAFKWLGSFIIDHSNHSHYALLIFYQDKSEIKESVVRQELQFFIHIWKDYNT